MRPYHSRALVEAAKLAALVRHVAALPATSPKFVLEAAADAIGWQKVLVLRAMEGR